jgi:hypothetical protein
MNTLSRDCAVEHESIKLFNNWIFLHFCVCSHFELHSFPGPLGASPEPIFTYFAVIVHDDDEDDEIPCPRTNLVGGGSGDSSVSSCNRLKTKTTTKYDSLPRAVATSPNDAGPGGARSRLKSAALDVSAKVGIAGTDRAIFVNYLSLF